MRLKGYSYNMYLLIIACLSVLVFAGAVKGEGLRSNLKAIVFDSAEGVAQNQARVVLYRTQGSEMHEGVVSIYLDNELVTALKTGQYSDFCVQPGRHAVDVYFNEVSLPLENANSAYDAELHAGMTHFLRINGKDDGKLIVVAKEAALSELRGVLRESHLLSRASQAEPCAVAE